MRPVRITLNAIGFSQWIPIDYVESWFGIGVAVIPSEDGNLTYTVQHTFDSEQASASQPSNKVSIARAATVATVTDFGILGIGHGLSTGDSVIIRGSGSTVLDSPAPQWGPGDVGWNVVSTPSPSTYTYTVANSGPTADGGNAYSSRLRVFPHATLAAQTTRQTGTYNYPVRALRLWVSVCNAGFVDMILLQGIAA